jgi:dynein heavy chain
MQYDSSEAARRAAKKQSTLKVGHGHDGKGLTRGALFTDTHREDAKAYELPPTRTNHAATIKALRATVSHAGGGGGAASGGASASHQKHVGARLSGAVPAPIPAAAPGAGLSSTMDIVRAALGMHDESKVKELDELSSTLAIATANVTRSRRLSVSHVDQPGAPALLPPSDPSAIAFSGDAIADLPRLRTGEDTIAFFLRYGASCPVKFVTLVRQHKDDDDLFRPYDLRVVSPEDVKAEDAYFTMSGNGVVFIAPGEFSEFLSLAEWMRDASAFNICRSMRFFAQFLTRKTYLRWRGNVRFAKYMKQRASVRSKLFAWKSAFAGAIAEIGAQLSVMERVSLLDMSGSRYSFTTFAEAQSAARVIAGRALERSITSIQAAIDRVIIDVTRRAHPTGDEDDDEDDRARELKNKSMAAAKEAAMRKAAALRDAQAEESVLGAFVRRTDYMIVETLSRIVTDAFGALRTELTDADHRKSGVPGMFVTAVRFTPGSAGFDPSADELLALVDMVVADTIKATDGCSRLLFARGFREYVQGLPTDGGPGVFGAPSVAALLHQSVAFAATHGGIEDKFHADFANASTYVTAFDPVRPIWAYSQEFDFDKYRASEPSTYTLQKDMAKLKVWDTVLERMRTQHVEGCLFIDSKRLKQELEPITGQGIDRLKGLLMDTGRGKCRAVADAYLARAKVLDLRPSVLDKFAGHVERLLGLRDAETALMKEASSVEDMFKLLYSYDVKITSEDAVALDDMRNAGLAYTDCYRKSESFLEERLPEMSRQLDMNILKVNDALKALADSVNEGMYVDAATPTAIAVASLTEVQDKLAAAEAQTEVFTKWQTLFNTQPFEWHRLRSARKSVDTRAAVWNGLASWEAAHELWTRGKPFATVDVEELARDVQAASKASYATDKALGDSVTALWKSKVAAFKPSVGCVVDLGNKAMRERHWRRIYEECGAPFVAGRSDERTLSELLAIGVLAKVELVGEMSGVASGEAQLEGSLQKIVEAWASTDFITKSYREQKGVYILGGLEEVMTQLEDHAVTLQTMMGSRFIQGVRDQVEAWEKRLSLLSDTLDEWLACQKQWMYLETIFSAEDIQRQLPAEAAKFSAIDRSWKDIMLKTKSKPNVMSSLDTGDMLLKSFTNNNVILEQIQKSLEDYLETKRAGFPRFYFLSNDELLAILSQTRDPQAVQPHLQKCFDAIKSLAMAEDAEHVFQISGMVSSEGEKVPYPRSQQARGDVTEWLTAVEKEMRTSLYDHSKSALARYPSYEAAVERKDWYFTAPAQSIILVDQVVWTQNCAQALRDIASGKDKDAMPKFLEYTRKQLDNMVVLVRQDLTKLQRGLLGALTVIDVHARDVVTAMIGRKTGSLEEFEWTRQLRYYWDADVDNCVVRQTNTRFVYGYEYLGNCDRLVITPLTDQCYMTLTGALHLKLGGAPAGPAGTGKTETTKDLAKALANQCVVFNCSDGLDFMIMGRFFSGLAQAGAWACFDEFNRIDIEVLSVVAQQVMTIQQGLVARMPTIMFEGREIVLNQCFGVFITMNPGYAGRSELPDNLKSLFRPVSMMVPDYRLIAEIVLFSQGFADAVKLSYKMVQLYRLASEQLSKQAHVSARARLGAPHPLAEPPTFHPACSTILACVPSSPCSLPLASSSARSRTWTRTSCSSAPCETPTCPSSWRRTCPFLAAS